MKKCAAREDAQLAVGWKISFANRLRAENFASEILLLPGKLKNDIISAEYMDR